jgi:hypothetical protein
MYKFILSSIFSLILSGLLAQKDSSQRQMVPVQTFPVNARVIGLLEDSKTLAVLRIEKVDSNKFNLDVGSEILVEFYFTTGPIKNRAKLKGIKPNDFISVRLTGEPNAATGQVDFTAFEYVVVDSKVLEEVQLSE